MELLGINLTFEEYYSLMKEQDKGKELKVIEGKITAIDPKPNQETLTNELIFKKTQRLEELTKDFAQVQAGFIIEDIEERKLEFQTLLNEVRVLQGKEQRQIQK